MISAVICYELHVASLSLTLCNLPCVNALFRLTAVARYVFLSFQVFVF